MSSEKRGGLRQQLRFNIVVDDGASFSAGVVNDVSDTGLFLETALPLETSTRVKLTPVDLSEGEPITLEAEVVRIESTDSKGDAKIAGMGLRFLNVSDEQVGRFFDALEELAEQAARESVDLDPYLSVMVPKRALSDAHLEVIRLANEDDANGEDN